MTAVVSLLLDQRHDYAVHARKAPTPYPPMTLDGRNLVIVSCIMMALTTVWTIMRIMSKYIVGAAYLFEDYFYVLAVVLGGAGHNVSDLEHNIHVKCFYKTFLAAQVTYAGGLLAIKLSIILLTQRIFSDFGRWFRIWCWVAIGLSIVWGLYTGLVGLIIAKTKPDNQGSKLLFSLVPIFDIITDIIIVVLPMKVVSTLQMSKPHKIALYLIFGAGIITILFSGVRLYHTLTVDYGNITKSFASAPYSAVLQNGIAVMVASSPVLRPIFDRTIARWLNLSIRGNGRTVATGPLRTIRTFRGPATTRNRSDARTTLSRSDGFKQMTDNSDVDDSLGWEMEGLETLRRKSDQAQISAHAEAQAPDRVSPLSLGGGISVTHTFTIESHVTRLPSFSGFVSTDNQPSKADVA
ncbi:integral membrane protein [Colletotrichum scovillei]|uniref:Integral membrane protein n=1 Tax=Colletotrichum scovillei TaxID=1209932 RepID=A0A9P7UEJ6_9PEZI|nr:integral membrane protein [Colletotrichum scovillei]KAG7052324.1 integral membrane protein [Colletotrichum scovillei]KAG7064616.1 integral membrane protein [Colletotrichum scovillei]